MPFHFPTQEAGKDFSADCPDTTDCPDADSIRIQPVNTNNNELSLNFKCISRILVKVQKKGVMQPPRPVEKVQALKADRITEVHGVIRESSIAMTIGTAGDGGFLIRNTACAVPFQRDGNGQEKQ